MASRGVVHSVSTERIKTIVAESFDDEIEDSAAEAIADLVDEMVESIVDWSVKVAEGRGSKTLDVEDVRFICEQEWGISLKDSMNSANSVTK